MPSNLPRFTLRTEQDVLDKLAYIASKNERSSSQELVFILKQHIKEYEAIHGKLIIEEDGTIRPEDNHKMGKSPSLKSG